MIVQEFSMATEALSLNTVLEYGDKPGIGDQQYLQEIIRRRLAGKQRAGIVRRAKKAKTMLQKKQVRSGTARDLLANLNG